MSRYTKPLVGLGILVVVALLASSRVLASTASGGELTPVVTVTPPNGRTTPATGAGQPMPIPQRSTMERVNLGMPAITPSRQPLSSAEAAFSRADVEAYIRANVVPDLVDPGVVASVENVEFITSGEAARRLNTVLGLPDDAIVCFVTLRGNFLVPAPPAVRRQLGVRTSPVAYHIYDGLTGNRVIEAIAR